MASILHDAGKYGKKFQDRLRGLTSGVDHCSIGAMVALQDQNRNGLAAALAIEGHHIGLQAGSNNEILRRLARRDSWSVKDPNLIRRRLAADGFEISRPYTSVWHPGETKSFEAMFATRIVFSALVDADFLATELHFDGKTRPAARAFDPGIIEILVEHELQRLAGTAGIDEAVRGIRRDVGDACRGAAVCPPGLFTLTAPTGSGKTLAMLLFAARHARLHGLRRIVVALPYLTITDQTVRTYRRVLRPWRRRAKREAVLEHHSLAGTRGRPGEEERERERRAENWDAPIVITTTVQLFESLFANRPGACRKLHNLAKSVVLLDEVQTIPSELAVPTLASLSCLANRFHATVLLATATQPAFRQLHDAVSARAERGWSPAEICPPALALFGRKRRYSIEWPARYGEIEDHALLESVLRAAETGSVLVIANLKRQAARWLELAAPAGLERLQHLSTNMTPAHRRSVLGFWEKRENTRRPGQLLVTTQCVEAGVDLDFPALFRAFAPLDSLAQAAGRVNRNGALELGRLVVCRPRETAGRSYPDAAYGQAADETFLLLQEAGWPEHLEDPELFEKYFRGLYRSRGTAQRTSQAAASFDEAVNGVDFPRVADLYRLIPKQDVLNVLCPDGPDFEELARQAKGRLTAEWVRNARLHAVNVFRPKDDSSAWAVLEPVMAFNRSEQRDETSDWCVLRDRSLYDERLGLQLGKYDGAATIA